MSRSSARAPHQASRSFRIDQRGFTLIELMIAMVVSSLLVGFVFAIQNRMSLAYRSQSSVSEVQQVVRMAKDLIVRDTRAAGYLMPLGLQVSGPVLAANPHIAGNPVSPLMVRNDPDGAGPDSIHLFYADPSAATKIIAPLITDPPGNPTEALVSNDSIFNDALGNFVPSLGIIVAPPNAAGVYDKTCLIRLTGASAGMLTFDASASGIPYNTATNDHCAFGGSSINVNGSMIYRVIAHAYRIDPTRRDAGVLQMSNSGGLQNDWTDIGFGFTDLQVTRRYFEQTDSNGDLDLDGSVQADWYSGSVLPPTARLTDVNISIVARTFRQVSGVATSDTPELTVSTNINHNQLGDSPSVDLTDASRPIQYQGNHVYRWISERVDIRNPLGDGL